jgi:tetratricopeptide (TPR) repeat protein
MDAENSDIAALRRAVLDDPRNGEKRYLLGAELAQQRDYESAVLEMSAAVALAPFLHIARFQLGLLHLTMAQPHHALAVLEPLEELPDAAPLKHFKHALAALIADDFPACVGALERGIALNTDNEPLNHDMRLILEQVRNAAAKPAAGEPAAQVDAVRTDFSLYGVVKH